MEMKLLNLEKKHQDILKTKFNKKILLFKQAVMRNDTFLKLLISINEIPELYFYHEKYV